MTTTTDDWFDFVVGGEPEPLLDGAIGDEVHVFREMHASWATHVQVIGRPTLMLLQKCRWHLISQLSHLISTCT